MCAQRRGRSPATRSLVYRTQPAALRLPDEIEMHSSKVAIANCPVPKWHVSAGGSDCGLRRLGSEDASRAGGTQRGFGLRVRRRGRVPFVVADRFITRRPTEQSHGDSLKARISHALCCCCCCLGGGACSGRRAYCGSEKCGKIHGWRRVGNSRDRFIVCDGSVPTMQSHGNLPLMLRCCVARHKVLSLSNGH